MPKVSIYLPDPLYAEVRGRDLPVSTIAQRALEDAVRAHRNGDWVERARQRPTRSAALDTASVLDEVRGELGA